MSSNSGFGRSIKEFSINAIAALGDTKKAATAELFRSVIMDTPVDEGRLRANWQCTEGVPARGDLEIYDENGGGTVALATSVVMGARDGQAVWLVNNLPYAQSIEYGHSDKAPQGMVRKNVSRLSALVREAVRNNRR